MCTTSQYLYFCSHPASYRFRTGICPNPASSSCRIRDENCVLHFPCHRCSAKTRSMGERSKRTTDTNIMIAKNTWHIPSRCFIDIGFQNLDPFGTGIPTESADQADSPPPLSPISRVPLFMSAKSTNMIMGEGLRKPSPCCLKSRRMGAYQATRLEGLGDRHRGRIVDSFCGSLM